MDDRVSDSSSPLGLLSCSLSPPERSRGTSEGGQPHLFISGAASEGITELNGVLP